MKRTQSGKHAGILLRLSLDRHAALLPRAMSPRPSLPLKCGSKGANAEGIPAELDSQAVSLHNLLWANKKRIYENIGRTVAPTLAALRAQLESDLAGRVTAPFTYRNRKAVEAVPFNVEAMDFLTGGLPRGSLTEICAPPCSGRTSLLISALVERTAHAEACALVDGSDTFDPHSAEAAGVKLQQLLWVRCRNIEQALRSTDLLLQAGSFGLIALDLGDIPPQTVRHVPLSAWFRFQRVVEDTPTIFCLLDQEFAAKTCASLALRLEPATGRWIITTRHKGGDHCQAFLLDGFDAHAEVLRSNTNPITEIFARNSLASAGQRSRNFSIKAMMNYLDGATNKPKLK